LLHDTDGQVLLLGVIVVIALLAFMLAIPNVTQVTTQKMRAQTAADAGAFTGSIWLARALNLSANMNIGIKSMYTWMTALTAAEALALALYSDSLDASVRAMSREITLALFGNSDPVYTASSIYPQSIQKLAETAQWLYSLQSDVAGSFPMVAQTLGSDQARRNTSGGNPLSQNPGGMVLVRTEDTIPLFVANSSGDSLMFGHLTQLAGSLQNIPTDDSNIGPAKGVILIDSHNFEIKAYYGDSSEWCDVRQVLGVYKDYIEQWFYNSSTHVNDSGFKFFDKPGGGEWNAYLHGTKWVAPFVNPPWSWVGSHPGNNKYKRDTVIIRKHVVKKTDPQYGRWNYHPWATGDSILPAAKPYVSAGDFVDSSSAYPTDFYTGAESTSGNQGTKLRPRRLNPGRELHAVSYVWRLEDDHAPFGLSPVIGRSLFPRSRVAAPCPMLAVAQSEPYLARDNPTAEDYFFAPDWDVRLTPLDSAGVQDICNDTAYGSHSLNSLNLEDLRRYVLLP
jgi:Tfp pilus assembly protein FimT